MATSPPPEKVTTDMLFELCQIELKIMQDNIARYDQNGLTIKSWCITVWSAIMIFGIQAIEPQIILFSLVQVFGFALLELTYRRYQRRFILRTAELETILLARDLSSYCYGVNTAASKRHPWKETIFALKQPHFTLFYLILIAISIGFILYL